MSNYTGGDLSQEYKSYYRSQKKSIIKTLTSKGFSNITMTMGFNYYNGFATSSNGTMIYFSKHNITDSILVRIVSSYKDYTGKSNHYTDINFDISLINNLI